MAVGVTEREIQSVGVKAPTDRADLETQIVRYLAEVRALAPQDIVNEIRSAGGDIAMTDKEAKWICVSLEEDYQCDGMFRPEDLCKPKVSNQDTTAPIKHGGCVDPIEDTTVSRLLSMAAGKFGI